MTEGVPAASAAPRRTAPVGVVLSAVLALRESLAGLAALLFVMRDESALVWIGIAAFLALMTMTIGIAVLRWHRLTFTVGADDLRVESGVLARASRSVPYTRIHDINLEQGLLARVFGLVKVTFDTGAGGKEDVSLAYLRTLDGEELRNLVRARKSADGPIAHVDAGASAPSTEHSSILFAMGPRRIVTFGFFEFSLAAIAVLFGVTQHFEFLLPFDMWDWNGWQERLAGQAEWLSGLGRSLQVIGVMIALFTLVLVGVATGVTRTVLREWGFLLEQTERGFRRRRGLLTRTDVVMPIHRVQAMRLGTGVLRRRFGWHALTFLSLAQDAGANSHVVAPFGQCEELWPIARIADFATPDDATDWRRPCARHRRDGMLVSGALALTGSAIALAVGPSLLALVPLGLGLALVAERWIAWRHSGHAVDETQILSRRGWLAPRLTIAPRAKLQSFEFRQGLVGRLHGYGTIHLGVAGGTMAIPGVSVVQATVMRRAVLESIAEIDFSLLNRASSTQMLASVPSSPQRVPKPHS